MLDVNMIIANNIQAELKKENKKQVDLAEGIGVSKQTMSKIMNGARAINAIELHKISEYLHVSMDSLMKMPEKPMDTNVIHAFIPLICFFILRFAFCSRVHHAKSCFLLP